MSEAISPNNKLARKCKGKIGYVETVFLNRLSMCSYADVQTGRDNIEH